MTTVHLPSARRLTIFDADHVVAICSILSLLYLISAPIYWLPGVPGGVIEPIKTALLAGAFASSFVALRKLGETKAAVYLFLPAAVLLVVSATPGLLQTAPAYVAVFLKQIVLVFLTLALGFVASANAARFNRGVRIYTLAIAAISVFAVICSVVVFHNPGGFSFLRSVWSASIAFGPACALVLMARSPSWRGWVFWGAVYFATAATQLYYSGRAGLFFPIMAFIVCAAIGIYGSRIPRVASAIALVGALAITPTVTGHAVEFFTSKPQPETAKAPLATAKSSAPPAAPKPTEDIATALRLNLKMNKNYVNIYDRISSGRVAVALRALELIKEHPFAGYGFNDYTTSGLWKEGVIVHNEWLKAWFRGGLLFVLAEGAFFFFILWQAWKADQDKAYLPVFTISALHLALSSMVQPNAVIGVFQASAPFWFLMGAAIGLNSRERQPIPTWQTTR